MRRLWRCVDGALQRGIVVLIMIDVQSSEQLEVCPELLTRLPRRLAGMKLPHSHTRANEMPWTGLRAAHVARVLVRQEVSIVIVLTYTRDTSICFGKSAPCVFAMEPDDEDCRVLWLRLQPESSKAYHLFQNILLAQLCAERSENERFFIV